MKVKRQKLLENLYEFSLGGNGMVVGIPGIGKSYLLNQLKNKLLSNDILSFIIKIDNAYDSSDEAIASELRIDGNWIEILGSIQLRNENKAVLIFDAFDAARDEEKRSGFLKQIKKAKFQLKDKWNILVSVRTYDSTKSADLMKLFSQSYDSGDQAVIRKITIGELDENEIKEASDNNHNLYRFYSESTKELKEILNVPFFLKVLETILLAYNDKNLEKIKYYKSETQLLDFFWQKKINEAEDTLSKQQFLLWFTKQLVSDKVLSINRNVLFEHSERDKFEIFDYLRSENILEEVSFRNSRIAYAHNIFFDYAVNRLCLDHNYDSLLSFIGQDYSRAFFLRPSFVYFFTSLWYDNPPIFWELYKKLSNNKKKEIQLFVRLIINGTITSQFSQTSELNEILDLKDLEEANEGIRNILQSIRFIRKRTLVQDVSLLHLLSTKLHIQFLFEFSFLLERAIDQVREELLVTCGESARNLLSFILDKRNIESKHYLDRIGAYRAVELVAKTFATEPTESATILRRIFLLIEEPSFEIRYFTSLSDNIKYFLEFDDTLISDIYKLVYNHNETSTEKTQMGSSVVLNFVSERRQDFGMSYFTLEQFFPNFINTSPKLAILTGIEIINKFILAKEKWSQYSQSFTFKYQEFNCSFYPDYSAIWSDRLYGKGPEILGEHINSYLGKLFDENNQLLAGQLIHIYIVNAKVGFLWKLLMQLANKYPKEMFDSVYPLILVPEFLSSQEVSYEVRAFLEKVNDLLSDVQLEKIEDATFEAYIDKHEYNIQAVLSTLKPERFQTPRAIEFMSDRKAIENVKPFQITSSVTPYTTEEWLKDRGVDITDSHIAELTKKVNFLDGFAYQFLNETPSYLEYRPYLKTMFEIWEEIIEENNLAEDLKFRMLNSSSKVAAIASRNLQDIPDQDYYKLKEIIVFAFKSSSNYDKEQENNSVASGYSSTPRIEASEALAYIYIRDNDSEILNLYNNAISDTSSIVRYNAIKNLILFYKNHYETYRTLLFERLNKEEDAFNVAVLVSAINFKKSKKVEDANNIILILNKNANLFQHQNLFVGSYAELLLWLLNEPDITKAFETLVNGYKYRSFSNAVIFRLFKQIHTYEPESIFQENLKHIKRKLEVIINYIDQAGQELLTEKDFSTSNSKAENAFSTLDEIVMRIYFVLEANQRIDNYSLPANEQNRRELYFLIKPLIEKILYFSSQITDKGMIIGHTAHYLMQTLNSVVSFDPKDILSMVADITRYSVQVGYTFDSFSIREIVSLTEKLLADHRELLLQEKYFEDLLSILDIYVNSGWTDALELLWRLDEVFK